MRSLSWFKALLAQSENTDIGVPPDECLAEAVAKAIDMAVAQTNPRLKLLEAYRDRLYAPVREAVDYLHAQMQRLPPVVDVAAADWAETPLLRAFFATAQDIPRTLGASGNLRAFFDKHPALDVACFALGVAYQERRAEGISPYSLGTRSDLSRRIACFSSPWVMTCGSGEREVRQQLHDEWLDYLIAQSSSVIAEQREMRRGLEKQGSLLRVHLKHLHSGAVPAAEALPEAKLTAQLQENEQQLARMGDGQAQLEAELSCLCGAFASAQRYLSFEDKQLRLSHLNEVLDDDSPDVGQEVAFMLATFDGTLRASRAFFIGRVMRSELPAAKIDFSGAERLL